MAIGKIGRQLCILLLIVSCAAFATSKAPTSSAPVCSEKLSSCSCRLSDGQIIDLSPLQATPGPAFNYKASDGYNYQFNPCLPFQCGPDQSDAAVCQEMLRIIYTYTDYGSQTSAQFGSSLASGQLFIRYLSRDMLRTTTVNLVCDPGASDSTVSSQGAVGTQLTIDLKSRFACPAAPGGPNGGLSGGDILLIVFFCLVIVYLIAGVLLNRFLRQRAGVQLLPNVEFWTALPGLAADGAIFAFSEVKRLACRGRGGGGESYDPIK